MQNIPARKNAGRSLSTDVDRYPDGRRNYVSKIGGTIEEEGSRRLSSTLNLSVVTNGQHNGSAKFPKLEDCTHFHYDTVDIGTLQVCLYEGSVILDDRPQSQHSTSQTSVHLQVKTSRDHSSSSWIIDRSMDSLCKLDRQLHQCVFDRKYSLLPVLSDDLFTSSSSATNDVLHKDDVRHIISLYFKRLSTIAGNMINCAAILNWFETDNRGNRIIVASDSSSAINIPAVGAALVIKRYMAQVPDEISLEVGEIISLIDMPPLTECNWWRGKRQFEVGFFPADCVESISGRVPAAVVARASQTLVKPVLRKRGKLIVRLRAFFTSRPARNQLKRSGIVKERVFGCDLGELLLNSGHNVPSVLKFCTEVIESHGIVDGIYRLSGIASNIQKLRREFDDDRVPTLTEDIYIRDIHSISSLLKMYFRELPNPLLTYQLYDKFVEAIQDDENKLVKIHNVIQQLPPPHYRTCAYLMKHLSLMASFGKKTCMTGRNLAIVWAPNLLRCKELELMQCNITALKSVGTQAVITEFLINYADLLFNENLTSSVISRRNNSCRRQMRPKSLAISTPTKLLSLEEARQRALLTCNQADQQVFLDVGGGPAALPPVYHTVIDVSKHRHSGRRKKNPSTSMSLWKDLLGHKSNSSNRDSAKNGAATDGTSALGPRSSLSCLDKSAGEVSASKEMKQSAGKVEAPPKKGSRHLRARVSTSQSIHSSTPYSTPPIDSCSLEDLTTCGHQPVSFTSSGLTTALSKSFHRSQSVEYDPSEATTSRKSVTFSESTYSTLSETGASRVMRVSTALPEESLSSGASSDDVFMSASGSRECSTSPIEAPLKSIGSNVVRLLSKVKRDKKGLPAINSAEEEQNAELNSDIYYSINGSDSGSEQPAGSRRPTYSEPVHCVSDLCSDEDENYTCDSGKSDRFSFTKRFHSPVGYYSSTSKRSFHSGDVGLESSSALQMNLGDCLNVSRESDNSLFSRALGNNSTRCCDTDCDNVLEYRRCDEKRSSSTTAENRDDVGDICEPQTLTLVHSDSRLPTRYVDGDEHKGKSCVISGVHESLTPIPRQANGLPDETTETDRPAVSSAVLNNDYPHQWTDESVDMVKGLEGGCDEWRFIDDTDDDVFSDQPAGDTNQQDSETAPKLLLTSSCIENSPMDADLTSGSPFLSPPDSPSLLEAVTGVWLKEFGDKKGNSTKVDCNPKVRRVISEPVNCQQQMNLVADITPRHTTEYDSEGHTSPRHTTQCDTEGHWFTHRSRSSGSFFRHGPALDQVQLQCDAELPRLVVFGDSACVSECNISNNANQSLDLGCHLTCNEGFVSADDKMNDKDCRDQYQTAGAIFEISENFSNSSFGNGITSIPDVIRDATNSRATAGVSLRKKSVKELKSKFEQSIVNERLELTRASQIRKMPLPRYSRSQSYHGFQSADSAPVSSLNCNDTYGLSKFGRSIGVLTVDVVPCENIKRIAAVSNKAHVVRDNNKSHFTALDESRFIFKSVDDELQFMARYAVPSVSARISCFEPLLSASRLSPEFRTAPENKRARLSSCGSTVASNANRQNVAVIEACRVAPKSMIADGDDHCRSSVSGCDLLSLLDIPAMAALSLPKVSERKRLFEAESAKLLNGYSAEVRRSPSSDDSDHKQKSPSSKDNKENSCEVTDLKGRSTSRRKLLESSVPGDDDTTGWSENFSSMTRDSLEKVCDRVESNFAGVTAASQQHSLWTDPYILPT